MPHRDSTDADEHSPLIGAQQTHDNGDILEHSFTESLTVQDSSLEFKSTKYLILLVLGIGGLQIVWSVELSNGSPYLLSLGMSKALMAFVWLAGPMTGVLVQPYIGIISDRSRLRWGKRRPFMVAGALGTVVSSLLLSYAKDIVGLFGGWSRDQDYEGTWKNMTIAFATVMMWVLDFAINAVQASIRAFIVDGAPAHQQETTNAWASRIIGIGNMLGYVFGYFDLPEHLFFFGNTQFKVLCVIASIALSTTVFISCLAIPERNPQYDPPPKDNQSSGIIAFFKQVFSSVAHLSPRVRRVCEIQFCQWLGWFPFLFYVTTYIGQLYVNPRLRPDMTEKEVDKLWADATRVGTFALLIEAFVSFSCNLLLPFLVVPSYKPPPSARRHEIIRPITPTSPILDRDQYSAYNDTTSHQPESLSPVHPALIEALEGHDTQAKPSLGHRISKRMQIPGLTLPRAWMLAQLLYVLCTISTFFISTPAAGTVMVAVVGVTWSLTLWAPFALISADIAKRKELRLVRARQSLATGVHNHTSTDGGLTDASTAKALDDDAEEDRTGIILGLHNVAISAPQVVATLLSSLIFRFLQKDRATPGDTSVAWTLRLGGLAALAAAWLTSRMRETEDERDEK